MALLLLLEEENRRGIRLERQFLPRTNPLDYSNQKILRRFRMTREVLLEVVELIKDDLEHPTKRSQSIPALLQCSCAIRFFATGQLQDDSGDIFGFHQSTVSRIVKRVAAALSAKAMDLIMFPITVQEQRRIKEGFYDEERRIPNVIGIIDGSLIGIKAPSKDEETFISRKKCHAIDVQGICDNDLKFTNLVVNDQCKRVLSIGIAATYQLNYDTQLGLSLYHGRVGLIDVSAYIYSLSNHHGRLGSFYN